MRTVPQIRNKPATGAVNAKVTATADGDTLKTEAVQVQ